jgi:hypothetical protein
MYILQAKNIPYIEPTCERLSFINPARTALQPCGPPRSPTTASLRQQHHAPSAAALRRGGAPTLRAAPLRALRRWRLLAAGPRCRPPRPQTALLTAAARPNRRRQALPPRRRRCRNLQQLLPRQRRSMDGILRRRAPPGTTPGFKTSPSPSSGGRSAGRAPTVRGGRGGWVGRGGDLGLGPLGNGAPLCFAPPCAQLCTPLPQPLGAMAATPGPQDQEKVAALMESIQHVGLQEPVRADGRSRRRLSRCFRPERRGRPGAPAPPARPPARAARRGGSAPGRPAPPAGSGLGRPSLAQFGGAHEGLGPPPLPPRRPTAPSCVVTQP